jgi:3-hydroxypropanoate dehydrogenase
MNESLYALTAEDADRMFLEARTARIWTDEPVSLDLIKAAWSLAKMGPTSQNSQPIRFVVVQSDEAKARLITHMADANKPKVEAAPINLVLAYDGDYTRNMPVIFPPVPTMREILEGNPARKENMGKLSAHLQAAYVMLALRAVGLAAGPMGGFDAAGATEEFFAGTASQAFLVVSTGFPKGSGALHDRLPRLTFDEVAQVL